MIQTEVTGFHISCAVIGIFTFFGAFVSFLLKQRLYLSESLLALIVGVVAGPATHWLRPERWAGGVVELEAVTLNFCRLSLCVQVLLTGCQLPAKFLKRAWRSMTAILVAGMLLMWLMSSLLIWSICVLPDHDSIHLGVGRMPFLHALAVGACVTPTDPVLAATVVKGRWAEQHVPSPLIHLMAADSGANDGLGYPFLFLALRLISGIGAHGQNVDLSAGASTAISQFLADSIGYVVLLGIVWGGVLGYGARMALRFSNSMHYVDRESYFAFSIILAVLLIGTCGMAGCNDVLASFIAGNALSWDDRYRKETEKDSFEPTVDMFLNIFLFIYLGAICPWNEFAPLLQGRDVTSTTIRLWQLVCLAITILVLRRLPAVLLLQRLGLLRPHVQSAKEAAFLGFFGPIGVSAIFYLHVLLEFLRNDISEHNEQRREDAIELRDIARVIVWFVVISSVTTHGLAIFIRQIGSLLANAIHRHQKASNGCPANGLPPARIHLVALSDGVRHRQSPRSEVAQMEAGEGHLRPPIPALRRLRIDDTYNLDARS